MSLDRLACLAGFFPRVCHFLLENSLRESSDKVSEWEPLKFPSLEKKRKIQEEGAGEQRK